MTIASDMGVLTLLSLLQALRAEERSKGKQGPPGPPGGTPEADAHTQTAPETAAAVPGSGVEPGSTKALPTPSPTSAPVAEPGNLPSMAPWTGTTTQAPVPANLPPFPGPGWVADAPVTSAVGDRAKYWGPQLWNYGTKTIVKPFVQEQFGGRWLSFVAAWHPGDKGAQTFMAVEAWRLATAQPVQETGPAKAPTTPPPSTQVVSLPPPADVMPYPGPGAWQNNSAYIQRVQTALTWVAWKLSDPTLDPHGVDGVMGPNSKNAVLAFQHRYQLTADGMAGKEVASFLDDVVHGLGGKISGAIAPPLRGRHPRGKHPSRKAHRPPRGLRPAAPAKRAAKKKPHVTPGQRMAAAKAAKTSAPPGGGGGDGGGGGGGPMPSVMPSDMGPDMGPDMSSDMTPELADTLYPDDQDPNGGYGYDVVEDQPDEGLDDGAPEDGSDVSGTPIAPLQYGAWYHGRLFADLADHEWTANEVARLLAQSGWTKVTAQWGPYEDEYQFTGQWLGPAGVDHVVHPDEPGLVYAEWPTIARRRMQRAS